MSIGALFGAHKVRHHRVEPGENLSDISQYYYHTPNRALVIWQYNRDTIADPNNIYPGQVLCIPHV
jgi:nucleoid-associated protein YgaU